MFGKILVPLDGSELASRILWHVKRLLRREDSEVILLRVVQPGVGSDAEREQGIDGSQRPISLRVETARRQLEQLRAALSEEGVQVTTKVEMGDPAEIILTIAEHLQPSLVALASHGRSGLTRWVRGSVAERVLRRCPVPVLICNPNTWESPAQGIRFRRILVPLDGSDWSARVIPLVESFARLHEAEVVLLRVWLVSRDPLEVPVAHLSQPLVSDEDLAASLEPYRLRLEEAGLKAKVRVTHEASEARAILDTVEQENADLVAMTTHGRSGPSRWLFGSVAENVLRHCTRPLLVQRVVPLESATESEKAEAEARVASASASGGSP